MDVNTYLVESECEWNCNISLITKKEEKANNCWRLFNRKYWFIFILYYNSFYWSVSDSRPVIQKKFQIRNQAWKISIDYQWNMYCSSKLNKSFILKTILWIKRIVSPMVCLSILSILFNITNWSLYIFVFFSPTDIISICHSLWCRHHSNK